MRRSDISGRLTVLESEASNNSPKLAEDDPRVIAYRQKAIQCLTERIRESETGIKEWERLDLPERVQYWREKVTEAECLIESKGVSPYDDTSALPVNEVTLRIIRKLRFEVASENIDKFRKMLASANQEYISG